MPDTTIHSHSRSNAIVMLVIAIAFLIGARFVLSDPHSPEPVRLRIPVIGDINAPSCPSRMLTGVPCPICGITRSVANVVRGRVVEGFRLHPLAPLLVLLMIISIPISIWKIATPVTEMTDSQIERTESRSKIRGWIIVVLVLLAWLITLGRHFGFIGW